MASRAAASLSRAARTLIGHFGLDANTVATKAPRIADVQNLSKSLEFWTRKLNIDTIENYPEVLYLRPEVYDEFYNNFVQVFAVTDVPRILNSSPQLLNEDWPDLQQKIDFAINNIGAPHKQIIQSRYLVYPFWHIKTRFEFLIRTGIYIRPNKKDKVNKYTMSLYEIVESDIQHIVKKTGVSVEEYAVLRKMVAAEDKRQAIVSARKAALRSRSVATLDDHGDQEQVGPAENGRDVEDDEEEEDDRAANYRQRKIKPKNKY